MKCRVLVLLGRFPEVNDLLPDFRGLHHHGAVIAVGEFPEALWAVVAFEKTAAEAFGHYVVLAAHEHRDGATVVRSVTSLKK